MKKFTLFVCAGIALILGGLSMMRGSTPPHQELAGGVRLVPLHEAASVPRDLPESTLRPTVEAAPTLILPRRNTPTFLAMHREEGTPLSLSPKNAVTPPKPRALTIDFSLKDLATYKAVSASVSFRPEELLDRELRACLAQNGIPEYPGAEVHAYLKDLARAANKQYAWVPLRDTDRARFRKQGAVWPHWESEGQRDAFRSYGSVMDATYALLVPSEVLELVQRITYEVPESIFYVSQIVTVKDPFLAVGVKDHPMIIIAVWDEPGFHCPPLKRAPTLTATLK